MGAIHVLDSSTPAFREELRSLSKELGATLILDAITGSESSILLEAAPQGSTRLAYARLSGDPIKVDPGTLMKDEKEIVGFMLGNWLKTKGLLFKLRFINSVKKALDAELSSDISRSYPLENAEGAMAYYREHMSEGKIILKIGSY